jgi:hypothetical protein
MKYPRTTAWAMRSASCPRATRIAGTATPTPWSPVRATAATAPSPSAATGCWRRMAFDYETQTSYSIRLRVTDLGGLWYERSFTIYILPVNEYPPTSIQG